MVEQSKNIMTPGLKFQDVVFSRQNNTTAIPVLDNFNFTISRGEFVAVIGPSGCGKTTLLHLAAGLLKASGGEILLSGKPISQGKENISFVFQEPRLFPWTSVRKNIEWGLRARGTACNIREAIADELLKDVGLLDWAENYPHELSIGMQKRVALARSLATDSEFLLLDEPFSALDYQTRLLMQRFLLALHQKKRKTILIVTHEIEEALMADRILVLSNRPATIIADITIDLPRPREKGSEEFKKISTELASLLEFEVLKIAAEEKLWQSALNAEPVWQSPARTIKSILVRA